MNNIGMDALAVSFLLLIVWRMEIVKEKGKSNRLYLSQDSSKMIRGIMAILVVFHHLAQRTSGGTIFPQFRQIGYLAVAVFFFYSGYGSMKKYMLDKTYKHRYLLRRLPPILFSYLFATAVYWLMYAAFGKLYTLKDIIAAVLHGAPIVAFSWYVINILIFYVVFYLLMIIFDGHEKGMIAGALVYFIIWVQICRKLGYSSYWYTTTHLLILGMLWAVEEKRILAILKKNYLLSILGSCGGFLLLFNLSKIIPEQFLTAETGLVLRGAIAGMFVLALMAVLQKVKIGNTALRFLGSISFEIYLFQGVFMISLRNGRIYIQNEFLWCIIVLAGTIIFAYLAHILTGHINKIYKNLL